jgi:CheY-like chemotaxis protein
MLLVEDNPGDILLTAEMVEEMKLPVSLSSITDGAAAMEFVHRCQRGEEEVPDIILLDINLQRGSGLEVLRAAREHERTAGTYIAIYSGSNSPQDMQQAEKLGADAYLLKPMTMDEIERTSETVRAIILESRR